MLLAALVVAIGSLVKWAGEAQAPTVGAAQPPMQAAAGPFAVPTSEPLPVPAPTPPPPLFATDGKGFVDSNARCAGTQTAVALGRTERSFVVICGDESGHFEYLGLRLSDDAVLKTAAETTPTDAFLARNAGVTYAVSPTQLLVTAGDTVIKQEPMLEFHAAVALGRG